MTVTPTGPGSPWRKEQASLIKRIFYASGPGDIIATHQYWKNNEPIPSEVSLAFSGQIQDFCRDLDASAYFVSTHPKKMILTDGAFTLEHRPKPAGGGAQFHLGEILYGLGLLRTAVAFRAQVALIDSGCTHYFVLFLFRLFGIRVVPILHNTLWPCGFPPMKPMQRWVLRLDSLFWRWGPAAVIGVSPECERQVDQLRGTKRYPIFQTRAQFDPRYFARIPPTPPHGQRPFQVLFAGRIERSKGVFDLLDVASKIEATHPGLVRWEVCGRGPAFDDLRERHEELNLEGVVNLRGWTSPEDLIGVYAFSHVNIVPTRSNFTEGLAMTAAEAILAGRPVVTNPVVPALEVLRSACAEAKTDDVDSYVRAVLRLATDAGLYGRAAAACRGYQQQFYDRNFGLTAVLKKALARFI